MSAVGSMSSFGAGSLGRQIAALGFECQEGVYRLDGMSLEIRRGWPTLTVVRPDARADPLQGHLGRPGLWKSVAAGPLTGRRALVRRVWELPPSVLQTAWEDPAGGDGEEEPPSAFLAALSWALATVDGKAPSGWEAPPRDEVEAAIPAGSLTARQGAVLCQGSLVYTPERLALVFPVVRRIPADLPAVRRKWLEAVIVDTQERWRLVRLGVAKMDGGSSMQAEVDLTGAPRPLLEGLTKSSLAALQCVVRWLLRTADFLVDTGVACQALESALSRGGPVEREKRG
jgi:hypothetical protein